MAWTCRPCQSGDCLDVQGACLDPSRCACCGPDDDVTAHSSGQRVTVTYA